MYETYLKNEREWEDKVQELNNPFFLDNTDGEVAEFGYKTTRKVDGYAEIFTVTDFENIKKHNRLATISLLRKLVDELEGEKCDERKVKVFGEYEARTYEDKEMVNAVIQLAIDKINNFINKIK